MFTHKAGRSGTEVALAGRWWPSSQVHQGCGCQLIAPGRLAKKLTCQRTGEPVDRDHNAALNLRDNNNGPVGAEAPVVSSPASRGRDAGSGAGANQHRGSGCKTEALVSAVRGEAVTKTSQEDAA